MDKKYITKNYKQTQKLGEKLAREVLALRQTQGKNNSSVVFGLQGNLGGGKTTFLQGFAKGLGIKEKILSPTFVVMKHFKNFYHIDCYRLKNEKDILELDFKEIISNPKNIVAIEWPERIKKVLPKNTILINFRFIDKNKREIIFKK
ncbi:MAG: tRNA (adenosine(37)-N6)-threonylcarbamoyltransferase complex ATPase subunit type 1 TsaE [Candidatus Staskawiczbacteria bacterium]|nr:tRNA (adenosine(37)-N6)-threonylcarbamoyltransferase complex ATPase subunit type 1 TsaE [Candidatus Staskawiczbacteria bacterium]